MFVLDKWYFDVVSAEGSAFLGYSASLAWSGLRVRYEAYFFSPPDAPTEEAASFGRPRPPRSLGDDVAWHSPRLGIEGTWRRAAPRLRRRLLHEERNSILWLCHQPRARAAVMLPSGRRIDGDGYVERLRMTIPPGELPFDTMHWGRFHGETETLVWIEWQRGERGRWIFRNGVGQKSAFLTDEGLSGLDAGGALDFGRLRPLRDRAVLPALASVPGLKRRAVGRLATMHETRWTGTGTLRRGDASREPGRLIHEEVSWAANA